MNELQLLNVTLGIVASLATIIGAVRYKGADASVRWLAATLGVDLYDLSGGLETAIDREPPAELLRAIRELANDGDSSLEVTDLVTLAGNEAAPSVLIEEALLGEDLVRTQLLGNHLSDEELSQLIDDRELWPDPIESVAQLEDDRSHAYAWLLDEDATEEDRASLAKEIEETFVQLNQSDPEALHFVVRSVDEIRELDAGTIESYVKPWLKDSTNNGGEEENR